MAMPRCLPRLFQPNDIIFMPRLWTTSISYLYQPSFRKFSNKSSTNLPVLTLYTKDPCPLCDTAKDALQPLQDMFALKVVDITHPANKSWFTKYKHDIPVFHFEGKFLMKHRVDLDVLNVALDKFHAEQ